MRTTRIAITLSRTVNLGNHSSVKAEYTEEVDLDPDQAFDAGYRAESQQILMDRCSAGLEQALIVARQSPR